MFGDIKSLNSLNKVLKFSKTNKTNKFKLIYCPPYTLLNLFSKKIKNSNIELGAQNCHQEEVSGPFTGSISSKMLKKIGVKFSSVLHYVNASHTLPSDETATIMLTLCPSTLSAIELFCLRVHQQRLRKSVYGIHDSSILITCFPSL